MGTTQAGFWFLTFVSAVACGGEQPQPQALPPTPPSPPAAQTPPPAAAPVAVVPVLPPPLKVEVITGSEPGFLANSTIVSGQKEAILIDAQFTLADGKRVADAIKATGKTLTTVYVTHAHPDHYFGFAPVKEAFPSAKLVALPATVKEIQATWEGKVKQWKPMYKDAITATPVVPAPLAGTSLVLEGEQLEVVGGIQGDESQNSYVWIPSLKAVIAGDVAYDQVYPWTAETSVEERKAWLGSLDRLAGMNPTMVVPGHQKPEQKQDTGSLKFTKDYLLAFDEARATSKKPADLQEKMKTKYPSAALEVILKIGSEAAFKKPEKAAGKPQPVTPGPKASN
jgi:glyoxylase-like metal-dependent hydrolase (beta-lactamase superfamily II)